MTDFRDHIEIKKNFRRLWLGFHKLNEEMSELSVELGKLGALPEGMTEHWDRKGDIVERIEDEIADVQAALEYFVKANRLNTEHIIRRRSVILAKFEEYTLTGLYPEDSNVKIAGSGIQYGSTNIPRDRTPPKKQNPHRK